jgi:Domain of unknown function (DUF4440)
MTTDKDLAAAAEIERLALERSRALVRKDLAAMEQILAAQFTYTNASGEVLDRADYLARYIRAPEVSWEKQALDQITVRIEEPVAILTCRVHDLAWFQGTRLDAFFQSTYVFARGDTAWRCIAGHTGPAASSSSAEEI